MRDKHTTIEQKWRDLWFNSELFCWHGSEDRENNYSIDTPPPSTSGQLHMGHVFSYCHADFIARYHRMKGKNVFYPMGFDDNGLPTERLVERAKKVRGVTMASEGRQDEFVQLCKQVIEHAETEFEDLFKSIGISVDWNLKYQTISEYSIKLAQTSFLELYRKNLIYRAYAPVYWDTTDRTAIAQAEIIDREVDSEAYNIIFEILTEVGTVEHNNQPVSVEVMTTRPEMLPACLAVLFHPEDVRYNGKGLNKLHAITMVDGSTKHMSELNLHNAMVRTPLMPISVPMIADPDVDQQKGTGLVMCCSYGDWQDVEWIRRHNEHIATFLSKSNAMADSNIATMDHDNPDTKLCNRIIISDEGLIPNVFYDINWYSSSNERSATYSVNDYIHDQRKSDINFNLNQHNASTVLTARSNIVTMLEASQKMTSKAPLKHNVKCAERSGTAVEILDQLQWYVDLGFRVNNQLSSKKAGLQTIPESIQQAATFKSNMLDIISYIEFHPQYMKERLRQWIEGLNQDWCISRDRFFGITIPEHDLEKLEYSHLPLNNDRHHSLLSPQNESKQGISRPQVFDTWFASSISPQLNTGFITEGTGANQEARALHEKVCPMNLRPQSHEIIRTWTFYTIVKSYLHALKWQNSQWLLLDKHAQLIDLKDKTTLYQKLIDNRIIPWTDVMLSGWCLARNKSKMSKSKGNTISPIPLIKDKGADAVRYWAASSYPGADVAYSDTKFRDADYLINKLSNVANFCSIHFGKISTASTSAAQGIKDGVICETMDIWIITRLQEVLKQTEKAWTEFDYCTARNIPERFFWDDFCDNYLEVIKVRSYGIDANLYKEHRCQVTAQQMIKMQQSAILTLYHVFAAILHLIAPFMPFICEEIYQNLFVKDPASDDKNITEYSIHRRGSWPQIATLDDIQSKLLTEVALKKADLFLEILSAVRKYKAAHHLSIKAPLTQMTIPNLPEDIKFDLLCICNALDAKIFIDPSSDIVINH